MPSPTADFFAAEVKRARQAKGLTQEQLARAVRYSPSLIASVETGRRGPRGDLVVRLDNCLHTDGLFQRLYEGLLLKDTTPEWFRPWRELEVEAVSLRCHHPSLVHGLLQSPDYIRAVLRADRDMTDEEVEKRVGTRCNRQARIFDRKTPPMVITVVDEAVLLRPVGGPKVMADQCYHLAALARRPRVLLQVLPVTTGMHPGLGGPFVIAGFPGAPDVVYLDGQRGAVVEHNGVVEKVKHLWESLRSEALTGSESITLILERAEQWENS